MDMKEKNDIFIDNTNLQGRMSVFHDKLRKHLSNEYLFLSEKKDNLENEILQLKMEKEQKDKTLFPNIGKKDVRKYFSPLNISEIDEDQKDEKEKQLLANISRISEEAETLEEQLKELEGYGSLYDLYPCGEKYYLGPKYAGVSSASTVKVTKYAIDGVKLSLMFTSYDLSSEDFGGKKSVTEEDLLNFLDAKGHLEYRLAGAVFTWLGKDKNILYVGTKGSKKGADDKETLDKMQLSIGRQRVMHQGEIYDILNHPCFYCGSSLESDQKLFIWKLEKVDISYWLAISRFFCENCDSEVAVHLFYDPKRKSFKWFVPFQQVYHASVEAEREPYLECYEVSGLVKVGEFHSHGRIPAFFSATDDEDETFPGLYGVVSCGDDRKVYRAVLGADKQIFLTEEQMKTVVYDSDEDRLSWVLGWFHQVYNKSIGNGSHYIVLVGQEKTKAIYVPSYEMARFFEGIFHVYSIDRGLRKDYCPQDHHFLISAEELTWRKGDPLLCGCGYADQLVALL